MHSWNTFGARTSHGQPWIHKTHHGPDLGEATTFPPYSILCTSPQGSHPNGFLSQDSQVGIPKLPNVGLLWLWGCITSRVDLSLQWGLKQSCSLGRKLSNGMLHAAYTWGNRVDSGLLVVGSQTSNLIPDLSFDHNLYFKCPNGWCKPILDIYISIVFQWYKEFFEPMGFDPYNYALKIQESIGTPTLTMEFAWECEGSFPHTLWHSRVFLLVHNLATPLPWSRTQD
jgi:hypothetical protein